VISVSNFRYQKLGIFLILGSVVILILPVLSLPLSRPANAYAACNCVIFRLDDVEDQGNTDTPNTAIMQHFISTNHKLSTEIIVNNFGNAGPSAKVFKVVKQGYDAGLFELGIHGFDHVHHSQLSEEKQSTDFGKAKSKLISLMGDPSLRLFVPPFNDFNSDTIKAMAENKLDIFSTSYTSERITTNVYKTSNSFQTDNSIIQLSEVVVFDNESSQYLNTRVYHVPYDISLYNMIEPNGSLSGQALVDAVMAKAETQIANTGFAVITLHPSDIAPYNSQSGGWSNSVSDSKFQTLKDIISAVDAKGYGFSQMSDVTPAPYSEVTEGDSRPALLTLNTIANVGWGTPVTVTGTLTDFATGGAVADANITFDGTGATNFASVTTAADGTFTATGIAPSTVATGWKVQAHFAGDSGHQASNSLVKTYNTIVHTVGLTATAAKSSVPWGGTTSFTVTMTDVTKGVPAGTIVSGRTVTLDGTGVIGVAPSMSTGADGKAIFSGTAPNTISTGWTYQAHFAGDSLYKLKDSTSKTYSTDLHQTALTLVKPASVPWGKDVTLVQTLKDLSTGAAISGSSLTFDNNGATNVGSAQTGTDGSATYTMTSPDTAGTYPYAVHFAGDSLYSKADATSSYTVSKHAVTLGLAILKTGDPTGTTSTTVAPGGSYKVQGTLVDSVTSAPLASKTITVTADAPITISSMTTNTNGFYSTSKVAPTTAGTYNIQSHFAGDNSYSSKDSTTRILTVSGSQATTLTLTKPTSVPWGKDTTLTATLLDSTGQAISGATITFDNNGISNVGSALTDAGGKASITIATPNSVGTFPYAAHYGGENSQYSKADGTSSYSTTKHSVTLGLAVTKTGDPTGTTSTTVAPGASYKVSGTLTDSSTATNLATKTITFTADSPITISDKVTNTNGFYTGSQSAPTTVGAYNIQAHYAGDALYNARDSLVRTLTVSGPSTASILSSSSTTTSPATTTKSLSSTLAPSESSSATTEDKSNLTVLDSSSNDATISSNDLKDSTSTATDTAITGTTPDASSSAPSSTDIENKSPVANAGNDSEVKEGTQDYSLDGTSSTDPDGDRIVKYIWKQIDGPTVKLDTKSNPGFATFDVPAVDKDTDLKFKLYVEDSNGARSESSDSVTVTVLNEDSDVPNSSGNTSTTTSSLDSDSETTTATTATRDGTMTDTTKDSDSESSDMTETLDSDEQDSVNDTISKVIDYVNGTLDELSNDDKEQLLEPLKDMQSSLDTDTRREVCEGFSRYVSDDTDDSPLAKLVSDDSLTSEQVDHIKDNIKDITEAMDC